MIFWAFEKCVFLDSVGQTGSWIAASARLGLPGCWFLMLGEQKEAGWSPDFSESDKVAPRGWVPLNPAALQGLFPAAGEAKNPSSTVAAHTAKSCSLPVWFYLFPE